MRPEYEARRKIIREWMSLPKDKRQTGEQAKPFAKKAMERIPSSGGATAAGGAEVPAGGSGGPLLLLLRSRHRAQLR